MSAALHCSIVSPPQFEGCNLSGELEASPSVCDCSIWSVYAVTCLADFFLLAETEGISHLWHYLNIGAVGFFFCFLLLILVAAKDVKIQAATKDSRLENAKVWSVGFPCTCTPKQGWSFSSLCSALTCRKQLVAPETHACCCGSGCFSSPWAAAAW